MKVASRSLRSSRHSDGLRAEEEVPAAEDDIDALRIDPREGRFQRRKVAVNVVEGGDSHRAKSATDSTCGVCGNMSSGLTRSKR